MKRWWLGGLLCAGAAGCVPTMPSQLVETADVLDKGKVGLTVAGGGGAVAACCGSTNGDPVGFGGGEARARLGVGAHQEVGVSAFGGWGGGGSGAGAFGGELAYKIAPTPWLAFVARGGAYDYVDVSSTGSASTVTHTAVFGGDLAAIVAGHLDARGTQIYGGVRGAFVVPDMSGAHGASESLTLPAGIMLTTSELVRFFLEAGFVAGWGQFRSESPPPDNYSGDVTLLGGYGAAGLEFLLR